MTKRKSLIKKCVMCGREFESYLSEGRQNNKKLSRRPFRSITCSKKCSKDYKHSYKEE